MERSGVVPVFVDYQPRRQFVAFHGRWQRFACIVTHRRAGKTVACIHDLHRGATGSQKPRPRYAYLAPFLRQSKAVAWDYLRTAIEPGRAAGASAHESELRIDYVNGGQVRLYGADNPDAMRGIYLDGVVLDEYADMDPRVWSEIIRPALADRQGWAVFIGTPKGRNGFFELWRRAQSEAGWFSLMLKASETGLIPASELELARRDLTEEQYAQEFECSFDAAVVGSYYGKLMMRAEMEKRIAGVPYDPAALVWTSWDLGIRDATAIWFAQVVGREIRVIDYYEASGVDLGHYVREIDSARMSTPATSCRTTRRPGSSAPARAAWRCWQASGSSTSRSRRCTGSRTASRRYACCCRAAGSTPPNARAASTRSSSTAPSTTTSCRSCARIRCTTGPSTRRIRSAISR
jgi:phage terminase large subunit